MNLVKRILLTLFVSILLAVPVALLSPGEFLPGLLASALVLWVSLFGMFSAWHWGGAGKTLAWMVVLAFLLRVVIGIAVNKALPVYGYDTEVQYHGYLFRDSHERDIAAWNLAQSDAPLWVSFQSEMKVDQYGGLLSLSAFIYRYISPDAHRPYLLLILGAALTAIGVPFFRKAVEGRWNLRLANLASWFLILYPDGILFGSSQMREPFLLGLSAIAFWAVVAQAKDRTRILVFLGSFAGMLLISSRVAIAIAGFLAVWYIIETLLPHYHGPKWLLWAGVITGAIVILVLSYGWFLTSASLDIKLTEMGSGWIQKLVKEAGDIFRIPIIVTYGLAQPVLPAAIAEPTVPLWRLIMVPRAVGWYALAPLIIYAIFSIFKTPTARDRNIFLWVTSFLLLWLLLSSMRAGGDAWDNPRYRASFLPWLALLAAWAVQFAIEHRDAWLARWLIVEAICLAFFTSWYFSRYYQWWGKLPFWQMVALILALSALVLSSGWWWRWVKPLFQRSQNPAQRN